MDWLTLFKEAGPVAIVAGVLVYGYIQTNGQNNKANVEMVKNFTDSLDKIVARFLDEIEKINKYDMEMHKEKAIMVSQQLEKRDEMLERMMGKKKPPSKR